jgi:hypothetical protein
MVSQIEMQELGSPVFQLAIKVPRELSNTEGKTQLSLWTGRLWHTCTSPSFALERCKQTIDAGIRLASGAFGPVKAASYSPNNRSKTRV